MFQDFFTDAVGDLQGKILKEIRITTSRNHNVENIIRQVALLVIDEQVRGGDETVLIIEDEEQWRSLKARRTSTP